MKHKKAIVFNCPFVSYDLDMRLSPEIKFLHNCTVAGDIVLVEVIQEAPALTHEFNQGALGVEILFVLLEVFGQMTDSEAEKGNLSFSGSCVLFALAIL